MTSGQGVELPRIVVAIDGPAGAGKSTVSRRVAAALDYSLLDTGALYRCVGLEALRSDSLSDPVAIAAIATEMANSHAVTFKSEAGGGQSVYLRGEDVSVTLRSSEAGMAASHCSRLPEVRSALLGLQRAVGGKGGVVVEGRDIGTVVFPDAPAKFFLTASVRTRAERRYEELVPKDPKLTLEQVESAVRQRDHLDSARSVAPLKQAEDAMVVDSTTLTIDEVVAAITERVREIAGRSRIAGGV